jgi:hypothetical protein
MLKLTSLLIGILVAAEASALIPDLTAVGNSNQWQLINGEFSVTTERGRSVLRLAPIGGNHAGSNLALALIKDVTLTEGSIDVDLRGNAAGQGSFLGVAFAAVAGQRHEAVYFRPFNFRAGDREHHAHAVQYIAWPDYPWDRLRASSPGVYESAVAPVPDPEGWFHARIDITTSEVRVTVDHARRPCLVVHRLGPAGGGSVGLWVDSQPGSFAGLRIHASTNRSFALPMLDLIQAKLEVTTIAPAEAFHLVHCAGFDDDSAFLRGGARGDGIRRLAEVSWNRTRDW